MSGVVLSFLDSVVPSSLTNALGEMWGSATGSSSKRNYTKEYDYIDNVTYKESLVLYKRSPFARRLVDLYPDAIWSKKLTIKSNEELEIAINGEFNEKDELVNEGLDQEHSIYAKLNAVDKLSKIGKFAILVIGINDGMDLKFPTEKGKPRNITFLQPYGYDQIKIEEYDTDGSSSNFGKPLLYQIKPFKAQDAITVHYSRVLHVVDSLLDDTTNGTPIMEVVSNTLRDNLKVSGGAAEIFFLNSRKGLAVKVENLSAMTDLQKKTFEASIQNFLNGTSRVIYMDGHEIQDLGSDGIDPEPVIRPLIQQLCAAGKVPESVLIGSGKSNDTSLQDRATMSNNIKQEQAIRAEPRIFRPFIKKLQDASILSEGSYEIIWPDSFTLSPLEKSEVGAKQARALLSISTSASITGESLFNAEEMHHIGAAGDRQIETNRDLKLEILERSQADKNVKANIGEGNENSEDGNNKSNEQGVTDKIEY